MVYDKDICSLIACLNLYTEHIIRNDGMVDLQGATKIVWRNLWTISDVQMMQF